MFHKKIFLFLCCMTIAMSIIGMDEQKKENNLKKNSKQKQYQWTYPYLEEKWMRIRSSGHPKDSPLNDEISLREGEKKYSKMILFCKKH